MIPNSLGKEGMEREGIISCSLFISTAYSIRGEGLLAKGKGIQEEEMGRHASLD